MTNEVNNSERTKVLCRHLSSNERECISSNIAVRVDRINKHHSIAFCSVEQRRSGLFQRKCSVHELIQRAEQALAPMVGMGIVPLITVRHASLSNCTSATDRARRSFMDRIKDLWHYWSGQRPAHARLSVIPITTDPFGWRSAMLSANNK